MLDGLCGSRDLVRDITELFRADRSVGMVGTAFQLRSADALMYGNRNRMERLLESLNIKVVEWPFFTGTMFWIAGYLLRDLAAIAGELILESESEEEYRTGEDGRLAHTLERVFGALCEARCAETYVTEPRDPHSGEFILLPLRRHGPGNSRRLLESESTLLVRRYVEAAGWCKLIRNSGYFDEDFYRTASKNYDVPGMDLLYHFVIYGDLLEVNPGPDFDVTYYQIRRPDVPRRSFCSLAHYLHRGKEEGVIGRPREDDWLSLSSKIGLFDTAWYNSKYPDVAFSGLSSLEHYKVVGKALGRDCGPKFKREQIPIIFSNPDLTIEQFLSQYYLGEQHLYSALRRANYNDDFDFGSRIARRICETYGQSRSLNESIGTYCVSEGRWEDAKRYWGAFWQEIELGEDSNRHGGSGIRFDRPPSLVSDLSTYVDIGRLGGAALYKSKTCIYTTLFGEIDNLAPISNPVPGIEYICFTDRQRDSRGWEQIIVDPGQGTDNLNAKIFKILPHKFLQEYEYSMFVDANTVFLGRTEELVELCMKGGDFVMWQHPVRDDIYTECCAIISHRRHSPDGVIDQLEHYSDLGIPRRSGMFEASFMWRRHMEPKVIEFMEDWWSEILDHTSRDQISLAWLAWKTGFGPSLLPPEIGTSRENIYFFKAPHRTASITPAAKISSVLGMPGLKLKDRDVTFLYSDKYVNTGSTVLRGQQLSTLVQGHYEGKRKVQFRNDTDVRDEIVVLTKGFLKSTSPEELRELKRRNMLVADFVDEPPSRELVSEVDVLMASSQKGYKEYLNIFSNVAAFHVTHHVDTRIPRILESRNDEFRAGYFGELVNTFVDDNIRELVSFNLVDTSRQSTQWIDELAWCNFHYGIRKSRGIDGAKPFLKGFVAAHCGSNIMIQKSAGDASFYLGVDYPYLMKDDPSPEEIIQGLRFALGTIGGPEWRFGLEIMRDVQARSSIEFVLGEFDAMLEEL